MSIRVRELIAPLMVLLSVGLMLGGCSPPDLSLGKSDESDVGHTLKVVATTNIVGDVVAQVGGDKIDLTVLMDVGVDPHTYVPTPKDVAAVHDADVVFANGVGLEEFLDEMLQNAGGDAIEIYVSEGLELLVRRAGHEQESEGEERDKHENGTYDPHVWLSVPNVIQWVRNIEKTLSELDPDNGAVYATNAGEYIGELEEVDRWIEEQISTIPEAHRKLVTNHPAFSYFADRYGMEQVGAIYPINPSSEPSASDLAALEDMIHEFGVPAVFTESTVNPKLAGQVTGDTGAELVPLYTGSLGGPGSNAESYVELMRYNVSAIVRALSE